MHVTSDTILNKMFNEVTEAKKVSQNDDELMKHIARIKLLCELLLDEKQIDKSNEEHMKQIIQTKSKVDDTIEEDDGTSIFDF